MPFDPNKPYVMRTGGFDAAKPFTAAPVSKPSATGLMSASARARADLIAQQAKSGEDRNGKPFIQAATFNLMDEASGAKAALETGAKNLVRRVTGDAAPYGMADAYAAGRDLWRDQEAQERGTTSPGDLLKEELIGGVAGSAGGTRAVGGAILKAPGILKKVLTGAAVGGAYGGAYGAGGAKEGDRLEGGLLGARNGAVVGAALPVAFAGAGKVVEPFAARLGPMLEKFAGDPATAQAAARARASEVAPRLRAAKAVQRAIDRDAQAGTPMRPGVAPMHAGGENLVSLYDVAANSPGPARGMIRTAIREHRAATERGVQEDLANSLGGKGDYFATLEQQQIERAAKAQDHFDAAYGQPIDAEAFNSQVAPIISRLPKGTLESAYDLARRDGRNPEELGLMSLDTFGGHDVGGKTPLDLVSADDLAALRRGSNPKVSQGPSMGEFLARNGGVNDLGGDLASIGAKDWHRARPFLGKLLKETGMTPEDAARRAHEAGYFPDKFTPSMGDDANMHPVGPEDLLSAIQDEIAGRPRFAREADPAALAKRDRLDGLEHQLREAGVDPTRTNQLAASRAVTQHTDDLARLEAHAESDPLPMSPNEPTTTFNPTLETLHYVKMALDQGLEKYRNPVSRKLDLEGSPEAVIDNQVRGTLVRTMRDLNPDYNAGMKIWGDESSRIEALRLGRDVLSDKMDMRPERVRDRVNDMSEAEHADFRKGVGEALLDKVRGAGGDIRVMRDLLRNRNMADKVQLAFPDDASWASFLQTADRRVREADINTKIMGGSPTDPRQAARADLEEEGVHPLDILGDALTLNWRGFASKGVKAGLKAIPRKSRGVIKDPVSNAALGGSAGDVDELTALLNLLQAERAKSARRNDAWASAGGMLSAPGSVIEATRTR